MQQFILSGKVTEHYIVDVVDKGLVTLLIALDNSFDPLDDTQFTEFAVTLVLTVATYGSEKQEGRSPRSDCC